MQEVHKTTTVVDGLQINNWNRDVLTEVLAGGITGVNATVAVWEDPTETIRAIGEWYQFIRQNSDIALLAHDVKDLEYAKQTGRVGVLLGFQNTSSFGDDYRLVEVFYRLGVRIAQLTYNNQNAVGGACYEPVDSGLTRFGANVISEMNRVGMLVDLSHVGNKTSLDATEASVDPVAITHANPTWFIDAPRNKPQEVITAVAEKGGIIGCSMYPLIVGGEDAQLADFVAMIRRLSDDIGAEHVALGSDCTRNWGPEFLTWLRDGRWRPAAGTNPTWPTWPGWFSGPENFPRLTDAFVEAGMDETEIRGILGENWLRLFSTVFRPVTNLAENSTNGEAPHD
ncbi:MAG: membrane dipeptidase [Actinomycetaceae bacterium]|nr:membrane dipeptidase [Actinomycetaceae bacterium]